MMHTSHDIFDLPRWDEAASTTAMKYLVYFDFDFFARFSLLSDRVFGWCDLLQSKKASRLEWS
jgi:hypothetical protein